MKAYLPALILASVLAACASHAATSAPPLPYVRSAVAGQFLYVASANGGISVYPLGSTVPVRTLPADLPTAIAFDRSGNLYVANHNGGPNGRGYVSIFAPGSSAPARTISIGINVPYSLAFDSKGNLYVANYIRSTDAPKSNNGSVTVYRQNNDAPYRTILGVDHPHQVEIDGRGNLVVAGQRLEIYAPGAVVPTRTLIKRPLAFGIDSKNRIYAGWGFCANNCYGYIDVYVLGKKAPIADFYFDEDETPGIYATGFAFDSLGDFIASMTNGPRRSGAGIPVQNGAVGVWPTLHHHGSRHQYWLGEPTLKPSAVIVDPSDDVIAGSNGEVDAYLAHNNTLLYTITQGIGGQVTALAIAAQ